MLGVSRPLGWLLAVLLPTLLVPALVMPSQVEAAGAAPVTLPKAPKGIKASVALPKTLDATPRYLPQTMCNPVEQPGVTKLRALVLATYKIGGKGNTVRTCTEGVSEHADGRAWDWMVNVKNAKEKAAAADFLAWVTRNDGENARRAGIMYVIYNEKIWGAYRAKDGWRKSSGHKDHIHVSMTWNGARGNTSFWSGKTHATDFGPCVRFTGTPATIISGPRTGSCPAASSLLKKTKYSQRAYGVKNSGTVGTAQKALGIKVTKTFDLATWNSVKRFQALHDIPMTGVLDQPTYAALIPSSVTSDALKGITARKAVDTGLAKYAKKTLASGAVGIDVALLQTALVMPVVDRNGSFGAQTIAAVKKFQTAQKLPVTGMVTKAEWDALSKVTR